LKKIFVGNLPYQANSSDLTDWFTQKGFPANSIDLAVDRISGQPRGFGFVEMNAKLAARCVLACNGLDFLGRTLVINDASPLLQRRSLRRS
jgi:RNA recognition motif-containing protein